MYLAYTQDSHPPTNVRSQPSGQIIGSLQNHTVVTVKQKLNNGWLQIEQPIIGYISASLAKPDTPHFYRHEVGSVADWQHLLNGCGYYAQDNSQLMINDQFDEATIAVTKKFQQNLNLEVTGQCTLPTWQAAFDHAKIPSWRPIKPLIGRSEDEPPADNLSEAQKYDYCRQVILSYGDDHFKEETNQRNLLSFRQETSTKDNQWKGLYDDQTFMLWKDANGQKHCRKYKSNTEPSSQYEDSPDPKATRRDRRIGVDANGDGKLDLGRLPEDYYEYQTGTSSDFLNHNVLRPTQSAMAERDTSHDGVFQPSEPRASAGTSMLFHEGAETNPFSAGCQTMPHNEYAKFWNDLNSNGNPGKVGYTIVRWKSLSQA